jgi:phenylpropionate dioxygenase-like ring-hydroxylating dioxygenase large terminal subunit
MTAQWLEDNWWEGTRSALNASTGLNPAAYSSDDFFADERRNVFEQAWVCIGLADEVRWPGRLLVRNVGERSIIVTRETADGQDSGELHGFVNSCRHRGTELASADCEISNTIRCPYHRWSYATDGRLIATPRFDEALRNEFDHSDHGLVRVRVDTWGPLLFACLSEETAPLRQWLGDLPQRMAGYHLDEWTERESHRANIDANWKLISENFQEYYHLTWVHPELAKVSRVSDHYRYQGHGMYCGQSTTPVSSTDRDDWLRMPPADGLDKSDACSGRFIAIFPNVLLSVLPNHAFVMRLDPQGPGRTAETCSWLLPPTSARLGDSDFAPTREFWLEVNNEDIDIVQRGQRGLTRGAVPPGPLAPRFEEPLHRFHNMLADHMTGTNRASARVPSGDDPSAEADRRGTRANPSPATVDLP